MSPMFSLQQALAWLPGARLVGDGAVAVQRVHTDTRTLAPGDLFVALRGERFDAHDFVPQARAQGAVAALAMREGGQVRGQPVRRGGGRGRGGCLWPGGTCLVAV